MLSKSNKTKFVDDFDLFFSLNADRCDWIDSKELVSSCYIISL